MNIDSLNMVIAHYEEITVFLKFDGTFILVCNDIDGYQVEFNYKRKGSAIGRFKKLVASRKAKNQLEFSF